MTVAGDFNLFFRLRDFGVVHGGKDTTSWAQKGCTGKFIYVKIIGLNIEGRGPLNFQIKTNYILKQKKMKNKNTKRVLVAALIPMLLLPMMAPLPAYAQPAGNPPAGNIDSRFNTVSAVGSGGITVGADLSTNVAGFIKLISAGANSYYTTFTADAQTGNAAYTLPPALPGVDSYLKSNTSGVLTWSTATVTETDPTWTNGGNTTNNISRTGRVIRKGHFYITNYFISFNLHNCNVCFRF